MGRLTIILTAVLLLNGATCQRTPVVIEPSDTNQCASACAHLRRLKCPEGAPLEDGTSCEAFCQETQGEGFPLNPGCMAKVRTCSEVSSCSVSD